MKIGPHVSSKPRNSLVSYNRHFICLCVGNKWCQINCKNQCLEAIFFTFPASNGVRSSERCLQSIWHHSLTTQRHVTCLIYEIKEFFGFWCYLVVIFSASTALNDIRSPERCSKLIRHHLLPKQTSEMPIKLHQRISWF